MCVLAHWRGNISAQVYINPYCSRDSFLVKHVLTPFLPHGHNPFYGYLSQYMCIGHKRTAGTPYIIRATLVIWALAFWTGHLLVTIEIHGNLLMLVFWSIIDSWEHNICSGMCLDCIFSVLALPFLPICLPGNLS